MNQKISTLIGTILLIILSFAAGYFVWLAQKNNSIEIQTKIKPVDETANWQTYRNEKQGFEFKHPSDWVIYEPINEKRVYVQTARGEVTKGDMPDNFKRVWISYNPQETAEPIRLPLEYVNLKKNTLNYGGIKFNTYEHGLSDTTSKSLEAYWKSNNNVKFSAQTATEISDEADTQEIVVLKKILATFKFIK